MGNVCCPCFEDDDNWGGSRERRSGTQSHHRHNPQGNDSRRPSYATYHRTARGRERDRPGAGSSCFQAHSDDNCCGVCGLRVDPALIVGHRETCRANHRAKLSETKKDVSPATSETEDSKNMCVVCWENVSAYAFIPCGHVVCCRSCISQMSFCPICRIPREGCCLIDQTVMSQYRCKHCKRTVAPTFFDGHREVCALRMRQRAEEAAHSQLAPRDNEDVAVAAAAGSAALLHESAPKAVQMSEPVSRIPAVKPDPQLADDKTEGPRKCLECNSATTLVVIIPCGHFAFCHACAATHSACPLCCTTIKELVRTFE